MGGGGEEGGRDALRHFLGKHVRPAPLKKYTIFERSIGCKKIHVLSVKLCFPFWQILFEKHTPFSHFWRFRYPNCVL